MAIGFAIAGVLGAGVASIYAIIQGRKNKKDNMESTEDFSPSMASEGSSVPYVLGRVRIPGNIIWYGNMESEEIESSSSMGGKGGASSSAENGYKYYADCWQAIGMGKLNLVKTYVNDKELAINAESYSWNDGTQSTYPSGIEHANKIKGVAHIYINRMYLGENTKQFPTIHYVVDRVLNTPVSYQNMASGSNPAAAIYDLLVNQAMISYERINISTFNAAATFWNSKEYGINLFFDSQKNINEVIDEILTYIPGVFYIDSNNLYCLKAINPSDTYDREITQDDMKDVSFNRKNWSQTPNVFKATYVHEDSDFSDRVVSAPNPAAIRLAGKKITQTIDLKCFRWKKVASKRIWEIMKRDSYPMASCKFIANLKYSSMIPGQILRIYHDDYDQDGADFRITEIEVNSIDKNEVQINAEQCVESLHDDHYKESGGTFWTNPDRTLIAPDYAGVLEMPFTTRYKDSPTFLFLMERKKYIESGFALTVSQTSGGDYVRNGNFTTFSQRIKLDIAYNSSTYDIDDSETGMTISIPSGKLDINLESLSRANLFLIPRVLILDSEILAFQNVAPQGGGVYKLTGIVRGAMGTLKASHVINTLGWITYLTNNLATLDMSTFYAKMLFQNWPDEILPSSVTPISVSSTSKAKLPRDVGRIVAIRSGSNVSVQIWPSNPGINGAGNSSPESLTDKEPPFDFAGDFEITYSTITEIKTTDSFVISLVGAFSLTVKSRLNGYKSNGKTINVGASDGTYYG